MIAYLQIQEIERLAKAGVKVELSDITPQSDHPTFGPSVPEPAPMAKAIWERWDRNKQAQQRGDYATGWILPFELWASRYKDEIVVSVHPTNIEYEPFQLRDSALIFPSDTLMASIALWEREHR